MDKSTAKADLSNWLNVTAEAVTHKPSLAATLILVFGFDGFQVPMRLSVGQICIQESGISNFRLQI
jgi:hypothetical protein